MKKHTKYLGMVLPESLHNELNAMADNHSVTKSVLVRIAIEMYIESMKDVKPIRGDNNG